MYSQILRDFCCFGVPKVFFPQASGDLLVTSGAADSDLKDRAAPFQRLRQVARGQGRLGRRVVRSSVTSAPVNLTTQNIPNVNEGYGCYGLNHHCSPTV